ncbi:MAG: MmcB family DNA repair protein [Pseudomonadota bacterium]|nr:MmcB family DNA repair protein [Pseudomonadota bacterium]
MSDHGWQHDALAADLAAHLLSDRRMVWTDMQLGPSGSPRPDVYTLEKCYSCPQPTAYEIKISRSDLRSDTTSGKWQKYLQFAGAVIFAVPDGLCTPADIPAGCGLIVRKAATWRHVRKATRSSVSLPMDACMKLLIDGVGRVARAHEPKPRSAQLWVDHAAVRQKFGEAVARAARDVVRVQTEATDYERMRQEGWARVDREVAAHKEYLMSAVRKEMGQHEAAKLDLIEWLGLPKGSSSLAVRRAIEALRTACDVDARVLAADDRISRARYYLQTALHSLPAPEPVAPPTQEAA